MQAVSEDDWRRLVLEEHIAVSLFDCLHQAPADSSLCLNALVALTSVSQGDEEGARQVVEIGVFRRSI